MKDEDLSEETQEGSEEVMKHKQEVRNKQNRGAQKRLRVIFSAVRVQEEKI